MGNSSARSHQNRCTGACESCEQRLCAWIAVGDRWKRKLGAPYHLELRTRVFEAYQRLSTDDRCPYRQAIAQFNGSLSAHEYSSTQTTRAIFWTASRARWLELSNRLRKRVEVT